MIVLGFDTATPASAVALRLADGSILRARDDPAAGEHPGHATRLLAMIDELLGRGGVPFEEVARIAVGLGPGRFTGLRVGIATARGLAQSLPAELAGVSSLRALATPALARARREGLAGVLSVIDARRGEAFAAAYAGSEDTLGELAFPHALAPAALATVVARAREGLERADARGGADERPWLAVGDGAIRFRAELESAGARVEPDGSPLHLIDGGAICELGERADPLPPREVVPDYRRAPDANTALTSARGRALLEGVRS